MSAAVIDDTIYVIVLSRALPGEKRFYANMSSGRPMFRVRPNTRGIARYHKSAAEVVARHLAHLGHDCRIERAP